MENEHVLGGLTRKQADIVGQIEHTQAALRKLVQELDASDAAIRIFDPAADVQTIKTKSYPPRHAAFRGEMMRFVMATFRSTAGPITTREIALQVMEGRGLNPNDAEMLLTIRKQVGACIFKLARQGAVKEVASEGSLKAWVRG